MTLKSNNGHYCLLLAAVFVVSCGQPGPAKNKWENIDYLSIYRGTASGVRDNDADYVPGRATSCLDEDFPCN
jgi:hypothetical protein